MAIPTPDTLVPALLRDPFLLVVLVGVGATALLDAVLPRDWRVPTPLARLAFRLPTSVRPGADASGGAAPDLAASASPPASLEA